MSGPVLTYNNITFNNVRRTDVGNYTVVATSYVHNSMTELVGNDIGGFYLDILCVSCNVTFGSLAEIIINRALVAT